VNFEQQPVYLTSDIPQTLTSEEWLAKAQALTRGKSWSKEESSKFEAFMSLHQAARQSEFDREVYNRARQQHDAAKFFDPGTLRFFAGEKFHKGPVVSERGTRLETRREARNDREGSVTEMRTYTALNAGTGSAGGYTIPVGLLAEVLQQMRQYDQLLEASRWIFTPSGNLLNFPSVDDTSTSIDAVTLAELQPITQGPNPLFGNIQFPESSTWVTPQFLYSLQLQQDSPVLAMYFSELFGKSFARGMGKSFLATLLTNLTAGKTTASSSAITVGEIYDLMDSIDTAYAINAGFLMNLSTLLAVRQIITSGGQLAFPHEEVDGRPAILGKKVYLCPNMDSIGASNVPIIFGDTKRHAIRAVSDTFTAFRYDEKYMAAHQKAIQAYWRADSVLLLGSNTDAPMKTLVCHA
jgi:HK97 family phage major capsid protein